ncbi:MAG: pirin family protein [Alphaproteobacteria bacterium]|nr:pirin family protein [Alphaproteobacteria bacterium]TAD89574.1 MAG: pirin family protein [Alphaproteobacteria bacterium]
MLDLRPFASLGQFQNDWLTARYHFSFSNYYDPQRSGWGPLLVWNDDTIRAGTGFAPHGHRDMEIITYVRTGAISHGDDKGNNGITRAGEVQVMSAGSGIRHSEVNREREDTTLFQIWIEPHTANLTPRWEQRQFPGAEGAHSLVPLVSGRGLPDTMTIAQDATLWVGHLEAGQRLDAALRDGAGYLVGVTGTLRVNGVEMSARDGLAILEEPGLVIEAAGPASFVLADLPRQ